MLAQEDFKHFFQKTLKELNLYYVRQLNRKKEELAPVPTQYQNSLQQTLVRADETLKASNVKEALAMYDLGKDLRATELIIPDAESDHAGDGALYETRFRGVPQDTDQGAECVCN